MNASTVCDQCNTSLAKNEGFLFYSTVRVGPADSETTVGNLLLCAQCTDKLIDLSRWKKPIRSRRPTIQAGSSSVKLMNEDSIVALCRRHGFSPEESKEKARSLALEWWNDPQTGQKTAMDFWSSPPRRVIEVNCKCGRRNRFGDQYVGSMVKCGCRNQFLVPERSDEMTTGGKPWLVTTEEGNWIVECRHCGEFSDWDMRGQYGISFTLPFLARCPGCGNSPFSNAFKLLPISGLLILTAGILGALWWFGVFDKLFR